MTSVSFGNRLSAVAVGREPVEGARRALNVAVAALGLVVTAPLMAIIALAIKLSSRGPVFYTQTRVGLDRRAVGEPTRGAAPTAAASRSASTNSAR